MISIVDSRVYFHGNFESRYLTQSLLSHLHTGSVRDMDKNDKFNHSKLFEKLYHGAGADADLSL